jgi:hypothetical protein
MTKRGVHVTSAIVILVIAFFYQVTRPAFLNDHFDHLSKARQLLHGEYPVRDFFDPGRPLTVGVSAVGLALSHDTLLGEAVLTMGAIAIGVMLVYWLAQRHTGSVLWGYWAAACMLAIEPRLYNYPKVLVSMVAAWLISRYLDAPTAARAACLGAWGGLGFLFRHDLGVYLAVATLAALLLRFSRDTARDAAIVGVVAGLVAAPYRRVRSMADASNYARDLRPCRDARSVVYGARFVSHTRKCRLEAPRRRGPVLRAGGLDAGGPVRRRPRAHCALAMDPAGDLSGRCDTDRRQRARTRRVAVRAPHDTRNHQAAHIDLEADRVPGFGAARGLGE